MEYATLSSLLLYFTTWFTLITSYELMIVKRLLFRASYNVSRLVLMLKQAFCDVNMTNNERESKQNAGTRYKWTTNEKATLKQNESLIELCNMLIHFASKSVLMANFKMQQKYTEEWRGRRGCHGYEQCRKTFFTLSTNYELFPDTFLHTEIATEERPQLLGSVSTLLSIVCHSGSTTL